MLKKGPNRGIMSRRRGRRSKFQEKLARDRIDKLLLLIDSRVVKSKISPEKCIDFVKLIGKRYNQRLSNSQKIKFCRNCNSKYTSSNSRFRLSKKGWRLISCLKCGEVYRFKI